MKLPKKNILSELSWFVFGQGVAILSALVLIRLLTEYLSVAMYGQLALLLSILALVNQSIYGGIAMGVGRFFSISQKNNEEEYYFVASFLLFKRATIFFVVFGCCLVGVLKFISFELPFYSILGCIIYSILSGYNNLFNNIQGSARNRIAVALHAGMDGLLKIFFVLLGIYYFGSEAYVVIGAFTVSTCLVVISQYIWVEREYLNKFKLSKFNNQSQSSSKLDQLPPSVAINQQTRSYVQRVWSFSWPFSVWGVFTWAQLSSDRWSLQVFQTPESVGFYAALFEVGYRPITLLIGLVVTFITPIFFEMGTVKKTVSGDEPSGGSTATLRVSETTKRVIVVCLSITILAFMASLWLHVWLFKLVASVKFAEVSFYLPWMILTGGIFATAQVLALKMMSDLNTVKSLPIKLISSSIGIALNILGASAYGLSGVVGANVIFALIYFLMMLIAAGEILITSKTN